MDLDAAMARIAELEQHTTDLTNQFEAVKKNSESLLSEKKKAQQTKQEAEIAAKKAADELARSKGDLDQLLKSAEHERNTLAQQLTELQNKIASKEINNLAYKIANDIAFDADSADILSVFVAKRLKYTEDGVQVVNDSGELTVSSVDDLKKELTSTSKFKALLKGSQASGGRTTHANGSAAKNQDNQKLSPVERLNRARGVT